MSPRELTAELSLRPSRPKVMRLSGRVLAGLGGVSALVLGVAAWLALGAHPKSGPAPQLYNTDNRATAEGLSRRPHDYAGLSKPAVGVPQLGPPLPGVLGKPMLDAGVQSPSIGAHEPTTTATSPATQVRQQARQRAAQTIEGARTSGLFARQADAAEAAKPAVPIAADPALPALGTAPSPAASPAMAAPSEPDRKLAFLSAPPDHHTVSAQRIEAPASANVVQAGAVIAAALITGMRSDLPGQVTAQVTQAVYDSPTGRTFLIPQARG